MERGAEVLALGEDGAPAQARLKSLQAQLLEQALVIARPGSPTRCRDRPETPALAHTSGSAAFRRVRRSSCSWVDIPPYNAGPQARSVLSGSVLAEGRNVVVHQARQRNRKRRPATLAARRHLKPRASAKGIHRARHHHRLRHLPGHLRERRDAPRVVRREPHAEVPRHRGRAGAACRAASASSRKRPPTRSSATAGSTRSTWPSCAQQTERIGYPILGVVSQLNALCRDKLGEYCHWGATTQDITDTATVLQIREALALVEPIWRRSPRALASSRQAIATRR